MLRRCRLVMVKLAASVHWVEYRKVRIIAVAFEMGMLNRLLPTWKL